MRSMTGNAGSPPRLVALLSLGVLLTCTDNARFINEATVERWLTCEECIAGELDSVVGLDDAAVVPLAGALRGPTLRARDAARRMAQANYAGDSAISLAQYTSFIQENFVARYQKRAAIGLAAIRSRPALEALRIAHDSADAWGYRSDVLRVVEATLIQATFAAFEGSLSDSSVRFGSRVVVRPGRESWDGNESVALVGQPFGDSLAVHADADSIVFLAVGERGAHIVQITGLGPNEDTAIAPLIIVSLRYQTHAPATAPLISPESLPQRRFLVLGATGSDTIDHFRFQPPTLLAVTATVESPGFTSPSLRWQVCPAPALASLGPMSVLSGSVVDDNGTAVASAQLSIPGTNVVGMTNANGSFFLANIPPPATSDGFVTLLIEKSGFRQRQARVQAGATSVQLSVVADTATDRSARSRQALSVQIAGDSCRVLRVHVPGGQKHRIIRLGLTSP